MPDLVGTVAEVRERVREARHQGLVVGFVPSMGALHAGHARLLEICRTECGFCVASIFVNPLQFERKDDLEKYPRPMEHDLEVCSQHGVDLVFAPAVAELYPKPQATFVDAGEMANGLCGAFRHGHFRAVATVVAKLFNIVQPDRSYFGEKDAQQLLVIRRMVGDLNFPIAIVGVPTVREDDGLALSSRNRHLREEERKAAPVLYRALAATLKALQSGESDSETLKTRAREVLASEPLARLEYFEVVDPECLTPVETVQQPVLIAAAMWLGDTRLIDNVRWSPV